MPVAVVVGEVEPIRVVPLTPVALVGISVVAVAAQVPVRPLARQVEQGRLVIVWSSVFREVRRCTYG